MQALSTWTPDLSLEQPAVPETWVEAIFTRLHAQLGSKVADLYAGVPAQAVKAEWAEALAGFDSREIRRGLKCCQTRVFAPSLGEFLRLCRPALDPEVAWLEAVAGTQLRAQGHVGDWSHPAVYRTAREFEHELRTGTYRQHRKSWEWRLELEFRKGWQQDVPKPPQTIQRQPATRGPSVQERERLTTLRNAMVGASSTKPAT